MKGARTGTGSVDLDADPSENTQRWARFVATCLIGGLVIGISVLGLHFGAPHQPSLRIWRRKKKPVRVYMDGCFDMMHYGHCNALRQARALGDQLVVGVVSDSEITANKGPPVTPLNERMIMVNAVKWVDEVIPNAPYAITEDFMRKLFDEYKIDYIIHGDDPCVLPDGTDAYALAKKAGRYKQIKRTEGVSSTDIVGRMLLCVRERSISDNQNHSSLQRQFSHGHSQKFDDGGSGTGTRVSHFLPTSRRIVQFSNGKGPGPDARIIYIDGAFDLFHAGHVESCQDIFGRRHLTEKLRWSGVPPSKLSCGIYRRRGMLELLMISCHLLVPFLIYFRTCHLGGYLSILKHARSMGDFLLVGIHTDLTVSANRGAHRPIMNLHERSLSVLACRYVDEVIIGAPWEVSKDMITTFNISLVVHGTVAEVNDFQKRDCNPYAVPINMGIFKILDSPLDITTTTIIRRIVSNHEAYQKRNEKKANSERRYYEDKAYVLGD
ncbi:ethanolamine-phosphate cytidylyltransferase isoform X2 [Cucumis melo]|uniref:ethanolamine-phosphate cytidylyltransferase n=1 Tax=Cucumis melo TaxID=3656 RepID=A0A1S3B647_CUCME|nr:ethanolamine-phosphate cytidylyltransferase isoform X2 [Cucumis melo]